MRPDGVFTDEGPVEWTEEESALVLFYGAVADNGSTYPNDTAPQVDARHVAVTETTQPSGYPPGTATYVPPAGSAFLGAGGHVGVLQIGGVYVQIESSDENAVLAAARGLKAMPG